MSDLVSLPEARSFLGNPPTEDDALIEALLNDTEGLLESHCNRSERPFSPVIASRTEVRDGTGSAYLFLDYPIGDVTSIKLGYDAIDPDETLDPDDLEVVTWAVGSRRIARVDGGKFGCADRSRYVHITYATQADLPEMAKLAVKRVTALIYRQRGAEDATEENIGGYSRVLAKFGRDFMGDDPIWKLAVQSLWEPRV